MRKLGGMDCAKFKGLAMRRIAHRSLRGAHESPFNDQRCVRTPCKNTFGSARGLCTHCRCASMHTQYGPKVQPEQSAMRKLRRNPMDCAHFKGSTMRRIAYRSLRGGRMSPPSVTSDASERFARIPSEAQEASALSIGAQTDGQEVRLER